MNVVFLGGGRITSAMLAGLRLAKTRHRFVVHDRNPGKLRLLKKTYAIAVEPDLKKAVRQADLLLIAVRPDSVADLLRAIQKVDRPLLAVSLAAGVPLRALKQFAGRSGALGPRHAKPGLPQWAGFDSGYVFANVAQCGSQTRPRSVCQLWPGRRDPRKQVRRVYRHLLLQPWLSCAGCAGGMRAGSGARSKNCVACERACAG